MVSSLPCLKYDNDDEDNDDDDDGDDGTIKMTMTLTLTIQVYKLAINCGPYSPLAGFCDCLFFSSRRLA